MILTYAVGGLLLSYCIFTAITYVRFHWCKGARLSGSASGEFTEDNLNLIQADALFQQGRFFHEKALFTGAVNAYEKCFTLNGSHPLARQYHKYATIRKPSPSLAGNQENSSSNVDPEEFSPLQSFLKKDAHSQKKDETFFLQDSASKTLEPKGEIIFDLHSESVPDLILTTPEDLQPDSGKQEKAQEFYENGQTLSIQEIWSEAIAEYTKALELDSHFIKAYIGRASALLKEDRTDEAISDYTELIQLDPQTSLYYSKRGSAFLRIKKIDEAINDYSTVLKISPNDSKSLNKRGKIYFRKNLFDLAAADFTRAIILDPDFAEAYSNRGILRNEMGLKDEAQKDFIKAETITQKGQETENEPDDSHDDLSEDSKEIFDRGMLALQDGNEAEALIAFNRVVNADPSHPAAYFRRAIIQLDHRRLENAIADLTTAIECKPDFGEAYSKRGQANILSNLYIDAIDDFNKAIELLPDHLESYLNRGRANSQRGMRDEAIADFSKAIDINPESDAAYYNRGLEWQNLGNYDNAMSDLNHACELGNNAACVAYVNLQASV